MNAKTSGTVRWRATTSALLLCLAVSAAARPGQSVYWQVFDYVLVLIAVINQWTAIGINRKEASGP